MIMTGIYVPPGADDVLGSDSPVAGSDSEVRAVAAYLRNIDDNCRSYLLLVRHANLRLGDLSSDGLSNIAGKLAERLMPGAATLQQTAGASKDAFDGYAADLERIHGDAARLAREVNEHLSEIRTRSNAIEEIAALIRVPARYAWDEGAPGVMPEPVLGAGADELGSSERDAALRTVRSAYEDRWLLAASRWRDAIEGVSAAKRRWSSLVSERRSAEFRLVCALGDTAIGQLITLSGEGSAAQLRTIGLAVSGELGGVEAAAVRPHTDHPLLTRLIGSRSGAGIWDAPPDPEEVAAAWAVLADAERQELIDQVPWVIGNLPGLPFEARDEANRRLMDFYREHPQGLDGDQLELLARVQRILDREASQRIANPPIQLVALDLSSEVPRAAVGYGDLDSASHTTWAVPGMDNDAHRGLEGWDAASRKLYAAQGNVPGFNDTNAVVAWLGYDTPAPPHDDLWEVLGPESARRGAGRFAAELDGAQAARGAGSHSVPVVNVLAHSYGTTLATIALTLSERPVHTLTMLGSAGIDRQTVRSFADLNVRNLTAEQKAIYTTHASRDHLAPLGAGVAGRGQPNPHATAPFEVHALSPVYAGALSFSSEGDPERGLRGTDGHSTLGSGDSSDLLGASASRGSGYLDARTESLDAVAKITTERIDVRLEGSFTPVGGRCVQVISSVEHLTPIRVECR